MLTLALIFCKILLAVAYPPVCGDAEADAASTIKEFSTIRIRKPAAETRNFVAVYFVPVFNFSDQEIPVPVKEPELPASGVFNRSLCRCNG